MSGKINITNGSTGQIFAVIFFAKKRKKSRHQTFARLAGRYRLYMNRTILVVFALLSFGAYGEENIPEIDLDCDGTLDEITLNKLGDEFSVSVTSSSSKTKYSLVFGLAQPSRQDAICGSVPEFSVSEAATEEMHMDMFGESIGGYRYSESCKELVVSGGECDPIYIFFNHETGVLNWLRL